MVWRRNFEQKSYNHEPYWHNYIRFEDIEEIKNFTQEFFITSNKKQIHVDMIEREGKTNQKINIIFLHGTAVYSRFYFDFAFKLSEQNVRLFLPDMIGHGLSEGIRGHFRIRDFIQIVHNLIEYIKSNYKGKIVLMGSSLGGITTLYTANSNLCKTELSAIICHNAAILNEKAYKHIINVKGILRILLPLAPLISKLFPLIKINVFSYLPREAVFSTTNKNNFFEFLSEDPLLSDKYSLRAVGDQMRATMDQPIEKMSIPVLFLNGEKDELFSTDYMSHIFARLPDIKKEFVILKDAKHLIYQENTEECIKIVTKFLNEIT